MAHIRELTPPAPSLALEVSREEADVLLAALDFARSWLQRRSPRASVSDEWPGPPEWYQGAINPIEQALAAAVGRCTDE